MKTLDEIFEIYIDLKSKVISEQSYRTNVGYFFNHISPVLGDRKIDTLHYIDYQKFVNDLLTVGLKPKTVKNILIVLSGIYKTAIQNEWYTGINPIKLVELPRFDNKRYFTLSVDLQKKYIKAILNFDEPIFKDIFLFLLHGRRLSEVLRMKWEYIDLNNEVYYLPAKVNKSKKNLSFSMTWQLFDMLLEYQSEAIETQNTPFITGYVFINPKTKRPYTDIRKPWARLLQRANLPKMRMHDIRHLLATYAINELDISVEMVSHTLGHSDISITQRYINPKPENSKKVITKVFDSVILQGDKFIQDLDNDFKIADTSKKLFDLCDRSIKHSGGNHHLVIN